MEGMPSSDDTPEWEFDPSPFTTCAAAKMHLT